MPLDGSPHSKLCNGRAGGNLRGGDHQVSWRQQTQKGWHLPKMSQQQINGWIRARIQVSNFQARGSLRPQAPPGFVRRSGSSHTHTGATSGYTLASCEFYLKVPFPARGVGRRGTHLTEVCCWDFLDSAIPAGSPALPQWRNRALTQRAARLGCWGDQAPLTRKRKGEELRLSQSGGSRLCCCSRAELELLQVRSRRVAEPWWDPSTLDAPSWRRPGSSAAIPPRALSAGKG